MTMERLEYLLEQFEKNKLSPEERSELEDWYVSEGTSAEWIGTLSPDQQEALRASLWTKVMAGILQSVDHGAGRTTEVPERQQPVRTINPYTRLTAAAVIIALITGGAFWALYKFRSHPEPAPTLATQLHDNNIIPGGNKAVLTLAGGKRITLDSAGNGILEKDGGAVISKPSDGQLVYEKNREAGDSPEPAWNTLSTPYGGQYKVVLPDGTRVWLNAASTLRYPIQFTGNERAVVLNGEAYFEVSADKSKPFRVKTGDSSSLEVLGTRFNVNAYTDEEKIRTTLLDGSVRLRNGLATLLLQPGEQGLQWGSMNLQKNAGADVEEAIAWKEGLFQFSSADIHSVMRQIARWYNVTIEYRGQITQHFTGQAYRQNDLSQLLEILQLTGKVGFEVSGRKITVLAR